MLRLTLSSSVACYIESAAAARQARTTGLCGGNGRTARVSLHVAQDHSCILSNLPDSDSSGVFNDLDFPLYRFSHGCVSSAMRKDKAMRLKALQDANS